MPGFPLNAAAGFLAKPPACLDQGRSFSTSLSVSRSARMSLLDASLDRISSSSFA